MKQRWKTILQSFPPGQVGRSAGYWKIKNASLSLGCGEVGQVLQGHSSRDWPGRNGVASHQELPWTTWGSQGKLNLQTMQASWRSQRHFHFITGFSRLQIMSIIFLGARMAGLGYILRDNTAVAVPTPLVRWMNHIQRSALLKGTTATVWVTPMLSSRLIMEKYVGYIASTSSYHAGFHGKLSSPPEN